MRTKIDGSGRVVIPAAIRRSLGIGSRGGKVELIDTPDGVLLRPADRPTTRRDERGLLIVELDRPVSAHEHHDVAGDAAAAASIVHTAAGAGVEIMTFDAGMARLAAGVVDCTLLPVPGAR